MSLLDLASLVLAPTATKEGKVYSAIPDTGDGDLTFTRASSATRVNSAGLIEKVRTNLVKYSEEFDNAVWAKTRATITANAGTAPDGTSTADKMIANTANNSHFIDQPITTPTSIPFSFSVFAKAGEYDFLQINNQADNSIANFNLSDGTLGTISGYSASITDSGNGWYRCIATRTFSVSPSTHRIALITSATAARLESFIGDDSSGVYIWGAQYELSDIATEYIPTTSSAVSVGMTDNVPRLDYSGGGCPKLLLEPQTTALNQFSESFDNAFWIKNDVTIDANTTDTLDPSGYNGADKIFETATTARHRVAAGMATISAANHTASVFMKKGTARYGFVTFSGAAVSTIVVDLEDGTITDTSTSGTIVAQKVKDYANGWYRISVTALGIVSTTTYTLQFGIAGSATPSYTANIPSFAGSTSNYLYAWGANLTATSYATSYIPTYGVSSTRVADSCSKTGISELIGQSEGTIFVDAKVTLNGRLLLIGAAGNFIETLINSSGKVNAFVRTSVTEADILSTSTYSTGDTLKIAFAYKQNDFALYVNGTAQGTDTSGNVPTNMSQLIINDYLSAGYNSSNGYNQAILFPTRLTNNQLEELTK
jgi:hypothetical protein